MSREEGIGMAILALDLALHGPDDLEDKAEEAKAILNAVLDGKWDD